MYHQQGTVRRIQPDFCVVPAQSASFESDRGKTLGTPTLVDIPQSVSPVTCRQVKVVKVKKRLRNGSRWKGIKQSGLASTVCDPGLGPFASKGVIRKASEI